MGWWKAERKARRVSIEGLQQQLWGLRESVDGFFDTVKGLLARIEELESAFGGHTHIIYPSKAVMGQPTLFVRENEERG